MAEIDIYIDAAPIDIVVSAAQGPDSGGAPTWSSVTGKPSTFPPVIGSGAGDAVAGNDARLHVAATVTGNGISITGQAISLSIGTGSTQVAAGDHTHPDILDGAVIAYTETVVALGTVVSSATIAITAGTVITATLTASTACTFTMPTATAGKSFVLYLKQAAATGNGTATFTDVKWAGGAAPTITAAAGKMDILSFVADGANWYGSAIQNFTP
jgi:molybdopterin-binding protein